MIRQPHGPRVLVIITFDCSHFIVHVGYPNRHFDWYFNDQPRSGAFGDLNTNSPANANSLTIVTDGHLHRFPLNV